MKGPSQVPSTSNEFFMMATQWALRSHGTTCSPRNQFVLRICCLGNHLGKYLTMENWYVFQLTWIHRLNESMNLPTYLAAFQYHHHHEQQHHHHISSPSDYHACYRNITNACLTDFDRNRHSCGECYHLTTTKNPSHLIGVPKNKGVPSSIKQWFLFPLIITNNIQ